MVDCHGRFQFAWRRIWGDRCTYSESLSLLPSPRAAFCRHHRCLENRVTCYSARCSLPSIVLTPRWLDRRIEQKFSHVQQNACLRQHYWARNPSSDHEGATATAKKMLTFPGDRAKPIPPMCMSPFSQEVLGVLRQHVGLSPCHLASQRNVMRT